jgi:signal peptidase I
MLALAVAGCDVRDTARRTYYATTHQIVRLQDEAMLPTIEPGSLAAVDTSYYAKNPVRRFDLIAFKAPPPEGDPAAEEVFVLKRVIGLGGETLSISGGAVYVNGLRLEEPFTKIPHPAGEEFEPVSIPEGEYFFMGDNRPNSLDSRFWSKHAVGKSRFMGKVVEIFKE